MQQQQRSPVISPTIAVIAKIPILVESGSDKVSRSDSDSRNGDNNKDKSSNSSSDSIGSMISGSNPTTKASEVPG
jgi:hypothetical protein